MGRRLSIWMVLARLFQVLASFIPGAMNGWLLYYITANKLGPSKLMLVLEILVCLALFAGCALSASSPGTNRGWILRRLCPSDAQYAQLGGSHLTNDQVTFSFAYALLSLLTIHTRRRSRRTACMVFSVCLDVVFCFVDITIVALLCFTGLPSNCSGLTTMICTWSCSCPSASNILPMLTSSP